MARLSNAEIDEALDEQLGSDLVRKSEFLLAKRIRQRKLEKAANMNGDDKNPLRYQFDNQ